MLKVIAGCGYTKLVIDDLQQVAAGGRRAAAILFKQQCISKPAAPELLEQFTKAPRIKGQAGTIRSNRESVTPAATCRSERAAAVPRFLD